MHAKSWTSVLSASLLGSFLLWPSSASAQLGTMSQAKASVSVDDVKPADVAHALPSSVVAQRWLEFMDESVDVSKQIRAKDLGTLDQIFDGSGAHGVILDP